MSTVFLFVYYETIKRELNKRLIFECRCAARLKAKAEGCTDFLLFSSFFLFFFYYESLKGELKTKIETRLTSETPVSEMGEYPIVM